MPSDASLPPDRELERLLSEIHLRIRQERYTDAEARLAEAKALAADDARVLELEGDLAFARGKYRQAELLYRSALEADPTNDALEGKFATAVVKVHEPQIMSRTVSAGGDSPWSNPVPRPPAFSTLLSAVLPGLGQWYNGELLKAVIVIVAWLLMFFGILAVALGGLRGVRDGGGNVLGAIFSGWNIVLIILAIAIWAYAVIDAYLIARRTNEEQPAVTRRRPASTAPPLPPTGKRADAPSPRSRRRE